MGRQVRYTVLLLRKKNEKGGRSEGETAHTFAYIMKRWFPGQGRLPRWDPADFSYRHKDKNKNPKCYHSWLCLG